MSALQLSQLESALHAKRLGPDTVICGVVTDSRIVGAGELFVALEGEHFDGHNFLKQAQDRGAAGALVSHFLPLKLPQLQVDDTLQGLAGLASLNRNAFSGPVVGITGSNGKTSVKNLVAAVLSQQGATLATRGNYNNEIGVPLTLLDIAPEHQFAVVEMGASQAGDIAYLCDIARPTIALLLNVMPAHLEGLGSLEGVARTKGEIFDHLGADDTAIINADQPWAERWSQRAKPAAIVDFGLEQAAQVWADKIELLGLQGAHFHLHTPLGSTPIKLKLPGRHSVANALAAVAVGVVCGLSLDQIRQGLEQVQPFAGRLQVLAGAGGATVIDDCYNANPGSVEQAIDLLAECGGRRTLLLGCMRELGDTSAQLHAAVGDYARQAGIDQLWGVGPELLATTRAFGDAGRYFADQSALAKSVEGAFSEQDTVLVKGSRGAAMERVLDVLLGCKARAED